jgi:hypothetical protein
VVGYLDDVVVVEAPAVFPAPCGWYVPRRRPGGRSSALAPADCWFSRVGPTRCRVMRRHFRHGHQITSRRSLTVLRNRVVWRQIVHTRAPVWIGIHWSIVPSQRPSWYMRYCEGLLISWYTAALWTHGTSAAP